MLMFKSKKIIESLKEENKKLKDKIEELFLVEEKESLLRRDFNILENRFKNEEKERVRLGEKVVNLREEYKAKKTEFNVLENRFKNEERERKKLEVKLISMKEDWKLNRNEVSESEKDKNQESQSRLLEQIEELKEELLNKSEYFQRKTKETENENNEKIKSKTEQINKLLKNKEIYEVELEELRKNSKYTLKNKEGLSQELEKIKEENKEVLLHINVLRNELIRERQESKEQFEKNQDELKTIKSENNTEELMLKINEFTKEKEVTLVYLDNLRSQLDKKIKESREEKEKYEKILGEKEAELEELKRENNGNDIVEKESVEELKANIEYYQKRNKKNEEIFFEELKEKKELIEVLNDEKSKSLSKEIKLRNIISELTGEKNLYLSVKEKLLIENKGLKEKLEEEIKKENNTELSMIKIKELEEEIKNLKKSEFIEEKEDNTEEILEIEKEINQDEEFEIERKKVEEEVRKCLKFTIKEWREIYKYVTKFRVIEKRGIQAINQRIIDIEVGNVMLETPIEKQLEKNKTVLLMSYYFEIYNSGYRPKKEKIIVKNIEKKTKEVQRQEILKEIKVEIIEEKSSLKGEKQEEKQENLEQKEVIKSKESLINREAKEKITKLTELERMLEFEVIRDRIFKKKDIKELKRNEWAKILEFGKKYELCSESEKESLNLILVKIGFSMDILESDYIKLEEIYVNSKNSGFDIYSMREDEWSEILVLLRLEESEKCLEILKYKLEEKEIELSLLKKVLEEVRDIYGEKELEKVLGEGTIKEKDNRTYSFDELLEIGSRTGSIKIELIRNIDFDNESEVEDYYEAIEELENRGVRIEGRKERIKKVELEAKIKAINEIANKGENDNSYEPKKVTSMKKSEILDEIIKLESEILGESQEKEKVDDSIEVSGIESKIENAKTKEKIEKSSIGMIVGEKEVGEDYDDEILACLKFPKEEWIRIQKYIRSFRFLDSKGQALIRQRAIQLGTGEINPNSAIEEQLKSNTAVLLVGYYTEIYKSGYRPEIGTKKIEEIGTIKEEEKSTYNPDKVTSSKKIEIMETIVSEVVKVYSFDELLEIGLKTGSVKKKLLEKVNFDEEDEIEDYYDGIEELESRGVRVE